MPTPCYNPHTRGTLFLYLIIYLFFYTTLILTHTTQHFSDNTNHYSLITKTNFFKWYSRCYLSKFFDIIKIPLCTVFFYRITYVIHRKFVQRSNRTKRRRLKAQQLRIPFLSLCEDFDPTTRFSLRFLGTLSTVNISAPRIINVPKFVYTGYSRANRKYIPIDTDSYQSNSKRLIFLLPCIPRLYLICPKDRCKRVWIISEKIVKIKKSVNTR